MKLIVGLGNPGLEYVNTRHNIGFMYLDYIFGDKFVLNKRFRAMEYITMINNEKVIVIKPITYMNLSGEVVWQYVSYYKIECSDILVIQDDLDMNLGRIKLLFNHGDGGHNGIKNIVDKLSSKAFLRLKIGISKSIDVNTKDYVLGKFNDNDLVVLKDTFSLLNNFIDDYISLDRDKLIGKYNSNLKE